MERLDKVFFGANQLSPLSDTFERAEPMGMKQHHPEVFHKITILLKQDDDGYPPVAAESLWGIKQGETTYIVDNTPYYIYGLSKGDLIDTRQENNELIATVVIQQGGHSTLRVFAENAQDKANIIKTLQQLGAHCSVTHSLSLFSVDVAPECRFEPIDAYLCSIADDDQIAYEDACLQHHGFDFARQSQCSSLASLPRMTH
ncbi:DUF4265 domain-containing protein [Pseudomonas protegens]|uniref:DUF4265 domain-containing protein n=1 Tax=Pseudomonas protegens TaxID=380021 RepID=UPI0027730984|nr:DUF4265 domain-containing protein [Pseudomonas protegens]MDP9514868.1 DUF4265 domain-containing protein [Pseudomonas protegens]